jgi:hypothetical protein
MQFFINHILTILATLLFLYALVTGVFLLMAGDAGATELSFRADNAQPC